MLGYCGLYMLSKIVSVSPAQLLRSLCLQTDQYLNPQYLLGPEIRNLYPLLPLEMLLIPNAASASASSPINACIRLRDVGSDVKL